MTSPEPCACDGLRLPSNSLKICEFEGNLNPSQAHGSGDVKYHLGATGVYLQMFGDNDIQVSLTANPSHLEAVDPVLEGLVRAKQDLLDKGDAPDGFSVVPMLSLIHI